ncbi:formimidoylglutamase [Rhodohalobacter mucosus]|nr:formimidoylglutamase [Rhodohalobacter mucosus]
MATSDLRINEVIGTNTSGAEKASLIGFPSDKGVRINGGRTGAAKAPEQIFNRLMQLTLHPQHNELHTVLLRHVSHPHMLHCTGNVAADQQNLGMTVAESLKNGSVPVIMGGGHETAFGHYLGYSETNKPVHILNIDAHTDVRPLKEGRPHSGSPFMQAIEDQSGCCRSYTVMGLQPSSVARDHLSYVNENGKAVLADDLKMKTVQDYFSDLRSNSDSDPVMLTMDMDAVDQSQAPGVSAPNASGIDSGFWLEIAFYCGRQGNVASFDLCEVNPAFDRDDQTIRLAALTVWYFLLGLALR